jgi:hypothetical protein
VAGAWRTVAQKATPPALYWLVLSLITFIGMSAVIKIEATRTRVCPSSSWSSVLLSAQHAFWSAYCETTCGPTYSQTVNQATSPAACPNGSAVTKNISEQNTEERENGAPNPKLARHKPKKFYLTPMMSFDCFARKLNEPEAKEHSRENPR